VIAQIIAFGIAILDSLNRSIEADLPIAQILRLRANAASLGRLAEQFRRALPAAVTEPRPAPATDPETERLHVANTRADLARAQQRVLQASLEPGCSSRFAAMAKSESLTGKGGGTTSIWLARAFSWDRLNGLLIC
jgi:hypothetical protein